MTKNFAELERAIADLAVKARDKNLVLDDMVNGSFTITNGGVFGSMMSTQLLMVTKRILGMHSIITVQLQLIKIQLRIDQ